MLVGSWLSDPENGQWILILDNLDDSDLLDARQAEDSQPLREYLPRSTTGSIFITTRNRQAALKLVEFKDVINVSPMSGNDAEGLLRKKLGVEHDEDDIADLAAELEFMPLAIAQAAAYINQKSPLCSVRQYLDEFQQSDREKMNLLMYDGGQLRRDWDAKNSVFLTWQISFEYIQRNHPSAADLLALMSFFDRQGIPKWLLLKRRIEKAARTSDTNNRNGSGRHSSGVWAKLRRKMKKDSMHPELSSEETLAQGNQKEKDVPLDDDIQVLRDHSFVSVITDDLTFEMHRLVQLATQRWLEVHDQVEYWNAVFTMNLNSCTLDSEYADNCDQCRLLYLHSKAAMENPPGTEDALDRWESSMASAAHYAFQRGQWVDANAFALNGVQVTASRLGADHFITLKALLHSGSVLASTRHPDAEAMQMKALEGFTRTCGEDDQYTLRSMHELGYVYEAAEKWEKAEQMQLRVLRGFKKLLGEEHRDTLECMVRLAWIYNSQGRLEEAEALQVRIANAHQKMFGGQHPQYLHSMAMLALTYRKQKRYMEAETLLVEAGEISKRVLGEQNPETLRCLENLGVIYESQQRFDEAEKVYMEVLNAKKVTFGEDHWDTMVTWANLSSLYTEEGRLEEADDARVRTLKIRKKVIGRDNLDAMLDLHFLAIIRMRRGYITNAMDLMSQCLSRMYQNLGPEHEWTVVTERYVRDWEAEHLERGNATRDELHM
jgi:tetratricopeptide (TPR) repeat protein